jgi:UDP-N-acetylmuramoyl-tripeptide--D-alanyl-D-alanine ligase
MEVHRRPDGVTVVNDAYNANPDSVRAALHAVAAMARGASGRAWAVLGEMLELGDESAAEHYEAGRLAAELGLAVVAVGPGARPAVDGAHAAGGTGHAVPDRPGAVALLDDHLAAGDVVLVKASRGAGLDVVAAELLALRDGSPVVGTVTADGAPVR